MSRHITWRGNGAEGAYTQSEAECKHEQIPEQCLRWYLKPIFSKPLFIQEKSAEHTHAFFFSSTCALQSDSNSHTCPAEQQSSAG